MTMVRPYQVCSHLLVLLTLTIFGHVSEANDYASCQAAAQQAQTSCDQKVTQTQATNDQLAAANKTALSGSSDVPKYGDGLSNTASTSAANDLGAAQYCTNQIASGCDAPCTGVTDNPGGAATTKQNCEKHMQQQSKTMTDAANGLNGNATDSNKTASQSAGGLPPIPPIPSPSPAPASTPATTPSPSPTPTPQQAATPPSNPTAPEGTAGFQSCSGDSAYLNSACSAQMIAQCSGKFTSSTACQNFSSRYCSGSGSTGEASPGATQTGEGLGSSFCSSYNSSTSSFQCGGQDTASCPSCSGTAPAPGATIPDACKSDPAFTNPKVAGASSNFGSASSGLASISPSVLDQKSGGDLKKSALDGVSREGLTLGVDSGGGGASGNSGSSYDFNLDKFSTAKRTPASAKPAAVAMTLARASDVVKQGGPSVFSISSEILQNRCQAGRLLHCGPGSKGQ